MYEIEIDSLDISLYKRYMAGKITLWDVALELNKCGWTTFVDKDYAAKMIASIDLEEYYEKLERVSQLSSNAVVRR